MADTPSSDKDKTPAPEVLKPQSEQAEPSEAPKADAPKVNIPKRMRRGSYRPSHKATFIGMAVVAAILAINAGVIFFIMKGQNNANAQANKEAVTLSGESLSQLGVSRNAVGDLGTQLTVGPDAQFNGSVTVAGNTSIGGELKLNSKFSASDASLARLQAGDTSVNKLTVNGEINVAGMNVGRDLAVAGTTRFQGAVTMSQMLTVNNSVNIAGNLSVGGLLSARGFQASSLVSDTTLMIGGHIITRGSAPGVGPGGPALGSNGTVSISGNDAAGTIGVNIGTGASSGILAHVAFRQTYGATPHVVVTGIGAGMANLYINRTASGFSVGTTTPIAPGGYAIDYIVMQ